MSLVIFSFFFFNDTATTEIYTLSLHDALPIWRQAHRRPRRPVTRSHRSCPCPSAAQRMVGRQSESHSEAVPPRRSEEHTSELQSLRHLVCRLLLEKKKNTSTAPALTMLRVVRC